jgi:hypothetical protein
VFVGGCSLQSFAGFGRGEPGVSEVAKILRNDRVAKR